MLNKYEQIQKLMDKLAKQTDVSGIRSQKEMKSTEDQVFEVLAISQSTTKAGRKLFDVVNQVNLAGVEYGTREVMQFFEEYRDLSLLPRFGYTAQLYEAYAPFLKAGIKFLSDERNHYNNSDLRRRFKKRDELQAYAEKYANFPNRLQAVAAAMRSELSYWMRSEIPSDFFEAESLLVQHKTMSLGLTVHELIKEFGKRKSESLKLGEYVELCQLFLWQVRNEKQQFSQIIVSTSSEDQTLAKLLFELAGGMHLSPVDVKGKLPKNLERFYNSGIDTYNLFVAFFRDFSKALTDTEHPGHQASVELMTELNTFTMPEHRVPQIFASQPFTFQYLFGLVSRDAADNANYQEIIVNLHRLTQEAQRNQEWYQSLFKYTVAATKEFSYKVLFTAGATEAELFDTSKVMPQMTELAQSLDRVLRAGDTSQVTTIVSSHRLPIQNVPLKGIAYQAYMRARRIAKQSYVINVELKVLEKDLDEEELVRNGMFRYQVRVNNGETTVYLPLIDRETASEGLNRSAQEFVQCVFYVIDEELRADRKAQQDFAAANKVLQGVSINKQGSRAERIEAYKKKKKAEQDGAFNIEVNEQKDEENYVLSSAEEDAVSRFLPSEIIVSESMRLEMEKGSKKGPYARIYGKTAEFIEKYNEAGESKPGRGCQLTDVYGPNNENVWRFRVTYGIRCIVADLGGGKALMISAEDHDDAYGGVNSIRLRVANEIAKYWRETGPIK